MPCTGKKRARERGEAKKSKVNQFLISLCLCDVDGHCHCRTKLELSLYHAIAQQQQHSIHSPKAHAHLATSYMCLAHIHTIIFVFDLLSFSFLLSYGKNTHTAHTEAYVHWAHVYGTIRLECITSMMNDCVCLVFFSFG